MSAAAAAPATEAPAPPKGKKKLILIIAALVLVLAGGGVAAVLVLKKNAAAAAEAEGEGEEGLANAPAKTAAAIDPKAVPVFVPMEPFTVNLADRAAERYAQVGLTLEIDDAKTADRIKAFLPAIRNNILMAIGDRTAGELLSREGKTKLADKIRRETSRALGYEVPEENEAAAAAASGDEDETKASKEKPKMKPAPMVLPVKAVHFSNFIIQ